MNTKKAQRSQGKKYLSFIGIKHCVLCADHCGLCGLNMKTNEKTNFVMVHPSVNF
jgi:hypothetical protein